MLSPVVVRIRKAGSMSQQVDGDAISLFFGSYKFCTVTDVTC
jgi:hypothetical protein